MVSTMLQKEQLLAADSPLLMIAMSHLSTSMEIQFQCWLRPKNVCMLCTKINSNIFGNRTTTHPSTTWLFRAMVGDDTAAANWTDLIPTVQQSGLGDFCQPTVTVPSTFAGNNGVVNVVADGPDGLLYQCAAVSFVQGAATAVPTTCKNGTGVSASYAADTALSSLPASATATASSSGTAAASSSSAAGALTVGPMQYGAIGSLVWVGSVGVASFAAFLL
ncbi:hypothetical protein OCU04_002868 [Sclerotinia nivalis]|uniref:Copper acquisition factor BIM1-like domain-containing protein n=1 Tax=Sclerotinia nivalis TaxID=352851 RepID=A0A9X0DQL2_9HELO|nr:hypothetical protein OCU04_002868 [Sclerotinia nivalis]